METVNSLGILILAVLVPGVNTQTKMAWRSDLVYNRTLYLIKAGSPSRMGMAELSQREVQVREYALEGPDCKRVHFWAAYDAQDNTLYCQFEQTT